MANEQNLKRGNAETQFVSGRVAVEAQRKSADKRKQNNAERKLIKDRILEKMGEEDWDAYITGIIERAKDSRADAEFLRDTIGQKPVDKVAVANIDSTLEALDDCFARETSVADSEATD